MFFRSFRSFKKHLNQLFVDEREYITPWGIYTFIERISIGNRMQVKEKEKETQRKYVCVYISKDATIQMRWTYKIFKMSNSIFFEYTYFYFFPRSYFSFFFFLSGLHCEGVGWFPSMMRTKFRISLTFYFISLPFLRTRFYSPLSNPVWNFTTRLYPFSLNGTWTGCSCWGYYF